ncbi:peptide chain release factor N(5)-glutamine methyltransferase [Methylobacterium isbiliense]|jgi:release factor glutamine methyltransferase|uniref:Release factor glutamine methyltransferase n=1 Tax=Methylobacterium isbiliense TaxID=315478 RepID=A0ABQ4SRC4_9HYPH|nr:peptide chain release factor N(5)-glutamine methyltransferase [Methylobacterium isbiliense]MDN3624394.1 peptide chain release factor N(5)-glutamine methyltransferase [Methylobacterium isbiliense]GJE04344.1 Release factor glutamine methyltransferase [Methylobacterium isbiliense]
MSREVGDGLAPDLPRAQALVRAGARLAGRGIETAALDARILTLDSLGLSAVDLALRGDEPIGPEGAARLEAALARREAGEPVARILGTWDFWGLPFRLSPATLVPRPDTETVVEAALALGLPREAPRRLLDLGTGSGCLLVALLSEWPRAIGLGLDRSHEALLTARDNALRNAVAARALFVRGDWGAALRGPFDVIVSNPPYIAARVIAGLAEEVRSHDPRLALDGGEDGLDAYRVIIAQAPELLAPGGRLVVEMGFDQEGPLRALAEGSDLRVLGVRRDLAGHSRVAVLGHGSAGAADSSSF